MAGPGKRGRPPKPTSATEAIEQVDNYLDRNLPTYIQKLSELARQGDRQALIYLVDRRLGKPVERREDNSDKFTKVIERLAKLANRQRQQALPADSPRGLPEPAAEDGVVDAEWTETEPAPAGDLPGEGSQR